MNQRFDLLLGNGWYLLALGAILLVLPALFWKRRLGYLACISLVGACVAVGAWIADGNSLQSVTINILQYGATSQTATVLLAQSQHGAMIFAYIRVANRGKGIMDSRDPSPWLLWHRNIRPAGVLKYPVKSWVFSHFENNADDPSKPLVTLHNWQIVLPDFLVIAVLLVVPAWWSSRYLAARRRRRWKGEGRCEKCGYSLKTLTVVDERVVCPECGFMAAVSNRASAGI